MTSKGLSRRSKATVLAPVALLSGVWTASLFNPAATASEPASAPAKLPDGTSVPSAAIESPASVPVPGVIAPAVPEGAADSVVSNASSNGIPAPALSAYQRGAQIINSADESCNMPWELIAAVGRVESDHGRYGGNTLTEDGLSTPGIYGIALDGSNGTAVIRDTDGGLLDNDEVYDRAVGPMQFIPSTWQVVKVDANGDGERNPQDINDAALAAAVYLCSGNDDLGTREGQESAVFRYNRSNDYVNLVLRIMEAYSSGDFTAVPSGAQAGTTFSPSYSSQIQGVRQERRERIAEERREARERRAASLGGGGGGGSFGGSSSGGTTGGTVTSPSAPSSGGGSVLPGTSGGSGGGGAVGETVEKTVSGTTGTVKKVTEGVDKATGGATAPVTEPVTDVVTYAEAKAICLARGVLTLNLSSCIANTRTDQ